MTASGGNHGLAVATAAALLDLPATVYTPESVPAAKARRIEATGAKLIRHGATYAEAASAAMAVPDALYVPAYDHPLVIAGQGTCAAEAVADAPDVDALVVAVGGGGLGGGHGTGCRWPARGRGGAARLPGPARGAGGRAPGRLTGRLGRRVRAWRDPGRRRAVRNAACRRRRFWCRTQQILAARDRLWEEFRLAVEPAGAVPFAAWLAGLVPGDLPCLILCGANTDWTPAD